VPRQLGHVDASYASPTSHGRNSSVLGEEIWNLNDLRGAEMTNKLVARIAMIGMLFGTFTLGYVYGSVSTPRASAQLPGGLGGSLGAVGQLGSSITDMEQHVSGLQKNLDSLKKIQSALTGK
jgi:hypothetical protein